MDASSWRLFEQVRDQCKQLGIVLLQMCDNMGELIITDEAKQTFDEVWHTKKMDSLYQVEIPAIEATTLNQILL
jgi:hypothetical protein